MQFEHGTLVPINQLLEIFEAFHVKKKLAFHVYSIVVNFKLCFSKHLISCFQTKFSETGNDFHIFQTKGGTMTAIVYFKKSE